MSYERMLDIAFLAGLGSGWIEGYREVRGNTLILFGDCVACLYLLCPLPSALLLALENILCIRYLF